MRVALRRLLAVLMLAVGLCGGMGITAPTAGALGWGAIAISPDTGRVGYSKGLNSAADAQQAAIGLCNKRDCRAVLNFTNACGAVAQSRDTSWGWGQDHSSAGAANRALTSCSQYGAGCRVVGWVCS
jgi:hypothetical protein